MAELDFRSRLEKGVVFFTTLLYYLGGYFLINLWVSERGDHHTMALPGEADIPFLPSSIIIYTLIYIPAALMYLVVDDVKYLKKMALALCICTTAHFICFIIYPVHYGLRPYLGDPVSPILQFVQYYYFVDLPYNCFPSLHVSSAFIAAFFLNRYDKRLGYILFPLAIAIAFSVVAVKQHYILDAVVGFAVATIIYLLFTRNELVASWVNRITSKEILS